MNDTTEPETPWANGLKLDGLTEDCTDAGDTEPPDTGGSNDTLTLSTPQASKDELFAGSFRLMAHKVHQRGASKGCVKTMATELALHKQELDDPAEGDTESERKAKQASRALHASGQLMLAMQGLSVSDVKEGAFDTEELPQLQPFTGDGASIGPPLLPDFSQEHEGGLAQPLWSDHSPQGFPGYDTGYPIPGQGPAGWDTNNTAGDGYFDAEGYDVNYNLPRQEYDTNITQQPVPSAGRAHFSHDEGYQLTDPQTHLQAYGGDPHWQKLTPFPTNATVHDMSGRQGTGYIKSEHELGHDGTMQLHQHAGDAASLPLNTQLLLLPSSFLKQEGGLAQPTWSEPQPRGSEFDTGFTGSGPQPTRQDPNDIVETDYSGIGGFPDYHIPGFDLDFHTPGQGDGTFLSGQLVPSGGRTNLSHIESRQLPNPQTRVRPYDGDDHWQGFPTHPTTIGGHTTQSEATGFVKSEHGFKQELGTASTVYDVIPPSSDFTFRYSVPYVDDTVRRPEDPRVFTFSSGVLTRPVPRSDPYYRIADAVSSRSHGVAFADDGSEEEGGERGGKRVKQEDVL
jgi:hypothetical protein